MHTESFYNPQSIMTEDMSPISMGSLSKYECPDTWDELRTMTKASYPNYNTILLNIGILEIHVQNRGFNEYGLRIYQPPLPQPSVRQLIMSVSEVYRYLFETLYRNFGYDVALKALALNAPSYHKRTSDGDVLLQIARDAFGHTIARVPNMKNPGMDWGFLLKGFLGFLEAAGISRSTIEMFSKKYLDELDNYNDVKLM